MTMIEAADLKAKGNAAFSSGNYAEAIKHFTDAIAIDGSNHVFYSNRSACHASLRNFKQALEDAEKCVALNPTWPKGYSRKGAALLGLQRNSEAQEAYNEGLKHDPGNAALQKGLQDVEAAVSKGPGLGGMEQTLSHIFQGDIVAKIQGDPRLAPYLLQADYRAIVEDIKQDSSKLNSYLTDERIMRTLFILMGLDVDAMRGGASETDGDVPMRDMPPSSARPHSQPRSEQAKAAEPPRETDPTNLRVKELKEQGNNHYKRKEFDLAIKFYDEAWEASEKTEIAALTNKSAVLFEKGDYAACIELCEESVDKARELRADYKVVAKAFGRIGKCHEKQGNLEDALKYYNRSITECRTADILERLKATEQELDRRKKEAYQDPVKGEEARERGNELFKKGDFAEAVKEYTEAFKRNPSDVKSISNRAACYTKLGAIPHAIKDCNSCIDMDPSFVKPYLRKAQCMILTKDYSKCVDVLTEAKNRDTEGKHHQEIEQQMMRCYQLMNQAFGDDKSREEVVKKAMQDPEIQSILSDPAMRSILEAMETDPKSAQQYLRDPKVAANLQKLVNAGIVRMG